GAYADFLVGQVEIGGVAVGLAVDGHDLDAQVAAGANDAQRDLPTVGDQNALEHREALSLWDRPGTARCRNRRSPGPSPPPRQCPRCTPPGPRSAPSWPG